MINWNVVPMWWGESLPYTLFTEMEWIGKLSYMCKDFDDRLIALNSTVEDIRTDLDAAIYQINLNKSDITSLGNRLVIAESKINILNGYDKITITAPAIPTPVDDNSVRTYTIPLEFLSATYYRIKFDVSYTTVGTQPGTVINGGGNVDLIVRADSFPVSKNLNLYRIYNDTYTTPPIAKSYSVENTITIDLVEGATDDIIISSPVCDLDYSDSAGVVSTDTADNYISISNLVIEYILKIPV